jgi:hypothetical protein
MTQKTVNTPDMAAENKIPGPSGNRNQDVRPLSYPSLELDADCEPSRCWILKDTFLEPNIFEGLYAIQ